MNKRAHWYQKRLDEQKLFRLVGVEFTLGEYDCMITQVSSDEETATIIIMPTPGSKYFEGGKIEIGLK